MSKHIDVLKRENYRYKGIAELICAIFIVVAYKFAQINELNRSGVLWGINYNFVVYILVTILVFALYNFVYFTSAVINVTSYIDKLLCRAMYILFIAGFGYLYLVYDKEVEYSFAGDGWGNCFPREQYNHILFTVIMICLIIPVILMIYKRKCINSKIKHIAWFVISIFGGCFSYAPNIFKNQMWGLYHIHAYTNSIVNVANNRPYSDVASSIYGHYGIIYWPFIKILGDDYGAIAFSIALFAILTYLLAGYVVLKCIKHDLLVIISMLAIVGTSTTFFSRGEYFQIMPHRYLFPMMTLAFVVWKQEHLQRKAINSILYFVIGIGAVIFNLETGLCCLVTLAVAMFFSKEKVNIKSWSIAVIECIVYSILCFVMAYIFVNLYNIGVGGEWNSVKTFIYPIGSAEYEMASILRTEIQNPIAGYTLQIIVFLLSAFGVIVPLGKGLTEPLDRDRLVVLIIAVSGLGSLMYFMNRCAASCLSVSHIQFVLSLTFIASYFAQNCNFKELLGNKNDFNMCYKKLVSFTALFLVVWFAIEGLWSVKAITTNRYESLWETKSVFEDIKRFEIWKKDEVIAVGLGIPEMYYMMGLDNGIALTDWTLDMNNYSIQYLEKCLEEYDDIIVEKGLLSDKSMQEVLEKYTIVDVFEGRNFNCVYLMKQ